MYEIGVIFDMDGVIIDSELVYFKWDEEFLEKLGLEIPYEVRLSFIGTDVRNQWKIAKDHVDIQYSVEELIDLQSKHFSTLKIEYPTILNKDVIPLLKQLEKEKIAVALASSSRISNILEVLESCNIKSYFSQIVSGEQFKFSKPDPEIFLHTAQVLGIAPNRCVVIEDSFNGVTAAKRAGMKVIGLKHRIIPMDLSQADKIVASLKEVKLSDLIGLLE
jgi:beta-phosphoglucomutase